MRYRRSTGTKLLYF